MPGCLVVEASRRRRQVVLVVEPAPRIHLSAVLRAVPAHLVGVGVPGTVPGGEEAGAHPVDSALCVGKVKLVVTARAWFIGEKGQSSLRNLITIRAWVCGHP